MNVMNSEIARTDALDLPYQVILDLDDERYSSQAQDLVRLFKNDVDNGGNLDLNKALATVKAQPDLAIMGTISSTYKQSKKALVALTKGIAETAANSGALGLSGDNNELNDVLTNVFGNLKKQEGKPWFKIAAGAGGGIGETIYTYNLFYISHSPSTGSLLSATLLSCRVSIDAPIKDLLGHDSGDSDQSADSGASHSAHDLPQSMVDIKYEKYHVETEIKGVSLVKPVG